MLRHLTRFAMRRLERAFETGRILPYLVMAITIVVVAFGVLMRLVDGDDFPSLGLALWWAVTTVTTVGYGDVVPVAPAGRAVASALMIVGFASLSLLTGIIASALIARSTAAASPINEALAVLERLEQRLEAVERLVRADRGPPV